MPPGQPTTSKDCTIKSGPKAEAVRERPASHNKTSLHRSTRIKTTPSAPRGMAQHGETSMPQAPSPGRTTTSSQRKMLQKAWFQGLMSYHIHRPQSWKVRRQKYSLPRPTHPLRHKFAVGRSKGSEKQPYRTTIIAKGCWTEAQWPEDTKNNFPEQPETSKSKEQRVMHWRANSLPTSLQLQ